MAGLLSKAVKIAQDNGHSVKNYKGTARVKDRDGDNLNFKPEGMKGMFTSKNPLDIAAQLETAATVTASEKAGKATDAVGYSQSMDFDGKGAAVAFKGVYDDVYGVPTEKGDDSAKEEEKSGDAS